MAGVVSTNRAGSTTTTTLEVSRSRLLEATRPQEALKRYFKMRWIWVISDMLKNFLSLPFLCNYTSRSETCKCGRTLAMLWSWRSTLSPWQLLQWNNSLFSQLTTTYSSCKGTTHCCLPCFFCWHLVPVIWFGAAIEGPQYLSSRTKTIYLVMKNYKPLVSWIRKSYCWLFMIIQWEHHTEWKEKLAFVTYFVHSYGNLRMERKEEMKSV